LSADTAEFAVNSICSGGEQWELKTIPKPQVCMSLLTEAEATADVINYARQTFSALQMKLVEYPCCPTSRLVQARGTKLRAGCLPLSVRSSV
jgi:hypothetical protein